MEELVEVEEEVITVAVVEVVEVAALEEVVEAVLLIAPAQFRQTHKVTV
jgi:hypothetical protein